MTANYSDSPMYLLLLEGKVDEFNQRRAQGEPCELAGCDFRNFDLRGLNADGLDLRNGYFRQADLRGVDFSNACLDGASISHARISGTYFPAQLPAQEVLMSWEHGTRMRYVIEQK